MIQNCPTNVNNLPRPTFAPSYNAVQINLDTPTLNVPQPSYYYDYPQAQGQPYYPPVQNPQNPQPKAPVNVPAPQAEVKDPNAAGKTSETAPVSNDKSGNEVDLNKVLANLSDPDFDKQALQMEEITKKGLANTEDAVPYVQEEVFKKLFDIINSDSSKLAGPTEQQLKLREKIAENDAAIANAKQAGKDEKSVTLPNVVTAEEEQLANTITPLEQAERNKEYALFTTAVLQKTYGNEIEKRSGSVVPLTDLPGAAVVVDELKSNQNPAIRMAAIDALRFVQRPEYKNDLAQIYSIAQSDVDDGVAVAAGDALKSINS